jgi:hypothetical protein
MRLTLALDIDHPLLPMYLQACTCLYLTQHPNATVGHQMWHLLVDGDAKSKKLRESFVERIEFIISDGKVNTTIALAKSLKSVQAHFSSFFSSMSDVANG